MDDITFDFETALEPQQDLQNDAAAAAAAAAADAVPKPRNYRMVCLYFFNPLFALPSLPDDHTIHKLTSI